MGWSSGGTWLASRAATVAAVSAATPMDLGTASLEAALAHRAASTATRSDSTAHAAPRQGT
jgi:hypothetical protein